MSRLARGNVFLFAFALVVYRSGHPVLGDVRMRSTRVETNPERCPGCLACEVACVETHASSDRIPRLTVSKGIGNETRVKGCSVPAVPRRFPILCRQCDDPACVTASKTGALWKDDSGVMRLDGDRRAGYGMCQMVCPFGGASIDRKAELEYKFDAWLGLGDMACVRAWPVQALQLVTEG